ncbi:C39 family peptidase [Clostridium boliviensis]|uniref:C39 family peptidase n=1 Tax=Clostridium boliviensis TaxID=318465 RepID=A0ABU4GKG6_9CLOT|nr:C39 family peptidase [Clostridium boliviensis]MDW2798116.1 C39 family peptidase [Clostridium boliviensis]
MCGGGRDPLVTYGCGPTVMAMIVTSLTGNQVLPTDMANWAANNNGWCPGQGSYHRLIQDSASAYGLISRPIKSYTAEGIRNALDSGHLVIALMRKGHFTQQGHFIIITNYNADGSLRIADSNNYDNTKINWDPSVILGELNYRASNGGPLWAIAPSN